MTAPRLYRVTRRTQTHVWVRWTAYGPTGPRGLSHRMTHAEFKQRYLPYPKADGLDPTTYFQKAP